MLTSRASRIAALVVNGILTVCPPAVDAGALGKALSKEITGRIVARQTVSSTERQALLRILRDLDTRTLQKLEAHYGSHIPKEVLALAKQKPSTFLDEAAYHSWLRRAYPEVSSQELRGIVGDTHPLTGGVTINRNQANLVRTIAHERVHQIAHPRFRASLGRDLDEGATDYFASRVSGEMHLADDIIGYPAERDLAGMITARVGEVPLARAYFSGEFDTLAGALERNLGPRSFVTLQNHLRRGDLNAARTLLLGKHP